MFLQELVKVCSVWSLFCLLQWSHGERSDHWVIVPLNEEYAAKFLYNWTLSTCILSRLSISLVSSRAVYLENNFSAANQQYPWKALMVLILKSHFSAAKLLWELMTVLMFSNEGLLQETLPVSDDRELILELSVCTNIDQPGEHWVHCQCVSAPVQSVHFTRGQTWSSTGWKSPRHPNKPPYPPYLPQLTHAS